MTAEEAGEGGGSATRPWRAIYAMAGSQLGLIVAELLPTSMLTPIAAGLGVSEGLAGQTVTATAVAALIASLFTASVTRHLDRRSVLIGFSLLLAVANALCAFASGYWMLVIGRIFLGLGIGGFSSLMPRSPSDWYRETACRVRWPSSSAGFPLQ